MNRHRFFSYLMAATLVCSPFSLKAESQESLMKKRVFSDLDSIQNIFEVKYAPLKWKQEYANWDMTEAIEEAKNKINNLSLPDLKSCQVIMRDFFNTARDYHVGVNYYSTKRAHLPFMVKGANERYFVCYIDREQLTYRQFSFEEGDEILMFDGKPIHEVIQQLRIREYGLNTLRTDQALAELTLTFRQGEMGQHVPDGYVEIKGRSRKSNREISSVLKWCYTPEKISDFSKLGFHVTTQIGSQEWQDNWKSALTRSQFFDKCMVSYIWDKSYVGSSSKMNEHTLGCRSSYIPTLGEVIWQPSFNLFFDAYIFRTPSGKKIGYIRIPHYLGDEEEVEEFGETMNFFQYYTDALVIDQINNPGGSIFYMYGLASTLINHRSYTPKHRIALTQEEVNTALHLLPYLKNIRDNWTAQEMFGETLGGYPVDYEYSQLMRRYCHFIIDQWNRGNLYTDPTYLFGVNELKPHPYYRYEKPILLLVNSLDFSGGDFFPAIMKDNKRATILGTRTAGAGGYVISTTFPNHSGIKNFLLTASLAERIDHQPIENLGVEPDIFYELTPTDLQENYQEYVSTIVEAVESLVEKG